jgi:hypothetical protein
VETCPVATSSLPWFKYKKSRRNLFLGKGFIVNYDIKYRMGKELGGKGNDDE